MLCLEVRLNGSKVALAGIGRRGVLSAAATWVASAAPPGSEDVTDPEFTLEIAGMVDDAHLRWPKPQLKMGDHVDIVVVESEDPDPPTSREARDDAQLIQAAERRYFDHLKAKYGW